MINVKFKFICLFIGLIASLQAQSIEKIGKVSYKSSQNVYVQFDNTDGIKSGDTLFIKPQSKLIPALKVQFISSRSCAGIPLNINNIKVGDQFIAIILDEPINNIIVQDSIAQVRLTTVLEPEPLLPKKQNVIVKKHSSSGRISIQSYSSLTNGRLLSDDQRWRYTFSYYAENISESALSFSSYLNYSYRTAHWNVIKKNPWDNLKVYDLSIGYNFDSGTNIKLGRYLNPKVSSISSVDGIQFQKYFSSYFGGIIIGSRPDFSTLGFNSKLFEYGGYFGRTDTINNRLMENTLAVFNQTNDFKTDRRFMYFQHTNSLLKDFNLLLSSEVDFYSRENGKEKNKPKLTSLFISTHYSPARVISFSLSYDARKNVIYYETFKNTLDSIIENETRQGLRLGTNVRLFNSVYIGLNAGYRFLKKDIKPTRNFNGNLTYSQIPFIEISPAFSYSRLISNYVDGSIYGIRLTKYFSFIDYTISLSYTKIDYEYLSTAAKLKQDNITADLSGKILDHLYLTGSYEGVFESNLNYSRILFELSFRF
ncbi:MAG: hypothetical protein HXY50_01575 [Ignavibacteriaceae bacterium]|nr:hypothetical protein [Ignavibacteriaceae bacterium]